MRIELIFPCTIFRDLFVETHENVSILYADVVNFSGLTVTLPVKKLVETLNDLFGSFDEASERHNVLRIKFLGDCYYCVSGVPIPNSQHAKSCVDLGKHKNWNYFLYYKCDNIFFFLS